MEHDMKNKKLIEQIKNYKPDLIAETKERSYLKNSENKKVGSGSKGYSAKQIKKILLATKSH